MSENTPTPEHADAGAQAGATELTLEQQLTELQAKHTEVSDAYLRAKAEAENIRRRAEEEISKARKFAIEAFAESLLPVCDSLEAGLAIQNATPEQIREGAEATLRQLKSALDRAHTALAVHTSRLRRWISATRASAATSPGSPLVR